MMLRKNDFVKLAGYPPIRVPCSTF